jgi:hypothetical protein
MLRLATSGLIPHVGVGRIISSSLEFGEYAVPLLNVSAFAARPALAPLVGRKRRTWSHQPGGRVSNCACFCDSCLKLQRTCRGRRPVVSIGLGHHGNCAHDRRQGENPGCTKAGTTSSTVHPGAVGPPGTPVSTGPRGLAWDEDDH